MILEGQKYRTKKDIEVHVCTAWKTAYTGGNADTLPKGEEIIIRNTPPPTAKAVYCDLVNYEKYHEQFVHETDRVHRKYLGYYLILMISTIENDCELIK